MAKRVFRSANWLPAAVADTTAFSAHGYMAIQGGSGTQRNSILEVYMGGLATVSSPMPMLLARDSTVGVGGAALIAGETESALDPATALLAASLVLFTTVVTTQPQRSSTLGLLALPFNAFGGVVRWIAAPGEEIWMLGNTASFGEVSLSCFTGGTPGNIGSHIIYEPL